MNLNFNNSCNFGKNADIPPDFNAGGQLPSKTEELQESDRLLILALLFLLMKDGADMKLILALGYILL